MPSIPFRIKVILILFISVSTILPQQRQKTEANSDIVEYTNKEGLPTTNISNIVQTKDGYIWLSGIEGTYRFNGYEFDEVGKEFGLPSMQNMYYDSTKNILYFASPQKFITFDGKEFKAYSEKDGFRINGLPGQVISFIKADSKGIIWIGSRTPFIDKKYNGGLTKFESGKFSVYDSTNFPLDNALDFIETPYNTLIFSSGGRNTQTGEGSYVALYNNGAFKKIDESVGVRLQNALILPENFSSAIDKDGNTWLAFSGILASRTIAKNTSGVLMYDGTKFHQYVDFIDNLGKDLFPLQVYYSKLLDKVLLTTTSSSNEIFNSRNKSIYEFKDGKWKPSDIIENIRNITNIKTGESINDFRYSSAFFLRKNEFFPELLIFQTTQESQAQSSKYSNQLYKYENGKWQKHDSFTAIPYSVTTDGLIMSTTKGFGIYYPNFSKMLTTKDGLLQLSGGIPTLYTDRNGIVWISYSYSELPAYAQTFNTGVNIWDGKKLIAYTEKDGLPSNITFETFQDSKMRVWIPTSKGITSAREIKNSEGEWILKFNNVQSDRHKIYNTTSILETKQGEVYAWQNYVRPGSKDLIKADFYFGKFDGEKFVEMNSPFPEMDNKKKHQLFELREDDQNRLWFIGLFSDNVKDLTSIHSTIMIYDGKSWKSAPQSWNVPKEQLHYVGKLKNGIYFLTSGGFFVFNGKRFVDLSDSVNTNTDFRILKGASVAGTKTDIQSGERLYIRLRNRGLVIFDGTHLIFYTKKEGLPSTNISNPVVDLKENLFFQFPSGTLQIRGDKFQTYYDDENVVTGGPYGSIMDGEGNLVQYYNGVGLYINKGENKNYPLKISSVVVNKQHYYYNYPVEHSHFQNSFVFNYAALNYRDPRQTSYEHLLEGYDKEWSRPSNLPFVEYQNLPPGKYRFRIRSTTSNGMKTNEDFYSFTINPPWWFTWWAYGAYLIGFVGILGGVRKFELDRRRERENKKLLEAENARKTKELEEARSLQYSMLPKELPQLPHLDIAVYMKTATEVGGDYYDFNVHADGTLTVILGDATGHGMMSGMMVSIMKSLFMSDRTNMDLKPFFENASNALKDMQLGRLMMALTCIQIKSDRILTTNAGMPPLIVYRKNSQTIKEVVINNMPLGAMKGIAYDIKEFIIERGDTLLLMSDGFAELKNDNNEIYGYKRARNSFEEIAKQEPEEIVNYLKNEGKKWTNDKEPDDDVTFVVIKVK
ncbi:MAG: SpoIIE family protein phosphatase [Melioribacteraceae bacterium]|nr:SpoIIE family protein phosphatase [Melioribacteraceae bacterium]